MKSAFLPTLERFTSDIRRDPVSVGEGITGDANGVSDGVSPIWVVGSASAVGVWSHAGSPWAENGVWRTMGSVVQLVTTGLTMSSVSDSVTVGTTVPTLSFALPVL